jgi:hypothetical protein
VGTDTVESDVSCEQTPGTCGFDNCGNEYNLCDVNHICDFDAQDCMEPCLTDTGDTFPASPAPLPIYEDSREFHCNARPDGKCAPGRNITPVECISEDDGTSVMCARFDPNLVLAGYPPFITDEGALNEHYVAYPTDPNYTHDGGSIWLVLSDSSDRPIECPLDCGLGENQYQVELIGEATDFILDPETDMCD